jgi:hypothetical protein
MGAVRSILPRGVSLGAAAALIAASGAIAADTTAPATTTAPPFQLASTIKVGGKPTRIAFGYGAAWTLNTNGSVSRIDAGTGKVVTTSVGPNPRDIRAAYNRIWVLSSTSTTASLVQLQTGNAKKTGKTITIPLGSTKAGAGEPNGANVLGAGSNYVWVAGLTTWSKLGQVDPSSSKVTVKSWPTPRAFAVAASAVWAVNGSSASLQKRKPSNLAVEATFSMAGANAEAAGTLWLTYGGNFLWLSQSTPNDLGQVNKVSPTGGLVKGAVSKNLDIGLNCTAVGSGVWAAQRYDAAGSAPASLVELSTDDLAELGRLALPPGTTTGAVNCVAVGGGFVWVTDGVGAVYKVQPT